MDNHENPYSPPSSDQTESTAETLEYQRDARRFAFGVLSVAISSLSLGAIKLGQMALGLTESQFYAQYPAGWHIVVGLGTIFMAGLFYTVLKAMRMDRNTQAREIPVDEIQALPNSADENCALGPKKHERFGKRG